MLSYQKSASPSGPSSLESLSLISFYKLLRENRLEFFDIFHLPLEKKFIEHQQRISKDSSNLSLSPTQFNLVIDFNLINPQTKRNPELNPELSQSTPLRYRSRFMLNRLMDKEGKTSFTLSNIYLPYLLLPDYQAIPLERSANFEEKLNFVLSLKPSEEFEKSLVETRKLYPIFMDIFRKEHSLLQSSSVVSEEGRRFLRGQSPSKPCFLPQK